MMFRLEGDALELLPMSEFGTNAKSCVVRFVAGLGA
jgi:hypothetical protein